MAQTLFYVLAGVVLASAFLSLALRNLFHCALFLALTMFGISGIFLYLDAEFLAAVQVLIYVGAVTVLIIFGIMLTRNVMDERTRVMNQQVVLAVAAAAGMAFLFFKVIGNTDLQAPGPHSPAAQAAVSTTAPTDDKVPVEATGPGDVYLLGIELVQADRGFAFAFELVSVLLLSALVGAMVIARKDPA
jgi:NADH-quinone oxidoreductase subunit J